jgi:acyl carrier protein
MSEHVNASSLNDSTLNEERNVIDILKSGFMLDGHGQSAGNVDRATPIGELAIDSLQLSDIIFDLEDKFGVELSDEILMELTASEIIGDFIDTFLGFVHAARTSNATIVSSGSGD